jgi:predicted unusual protein kinase regulating ubiquinone biosynthesis (AarF/ABC1/UbiB family)
MSKREIAKNWAARTLLTARAGLSAARVAGQTAIERVLDGTSFDPGDIDALVDRLDELKGLSLKLGQMASLAHGPLPPRVQAALARLQAGATGLDAETVHQVIAAAYGRPVEEVFDEFEPAPFAAASIGQVHRARVDGRLVAVKVQYPGIERAIEHDLANLGSLRFLAAATSYGTSELLGELRARLHEECDYLHEAACQRAFRGAFAGRPGVVVPDPLLALCRKNVLVTEYVDGERFAPFCDRASQAARDFAGKTIFSFAFEAIFTRAAFNGDPHPGNYLFLASGEDILPQVAFLDFGCIRRFEGDFIERWRRFALAILDGDRNAFPHRARELGIVGSTRFDFDVAWESFRVVYTPMRSERFRFTPEFARAAFDALAWNANLLRTSIPAPLAFAWRLNWGLFSVLSALGAEADYRTPFREAVEAPVRPLLTP